MPGATREQLTQREHLRGFVLDAYMKEGRGLIHRYAVLTTYVMFGADERYAALVHGYDPSDPSTVRRIQRWADDYLAFAADKIEELRDRRRKSQQRREERYQIALIQCQQQCEHGEGGGPSSGGTGCPSCPMHGV